ncbi:TPA: hypothetical protein DEO28_01710 [Candidatus Dependentiae bacterium]|nr:MAG: hypothetical protein UR14_C0004G0031 [candidate division TM6 bacterium GW2011_GWE2_31_21]KKP52949.1 MAG: hypothetical protein UR43_C0008G0031 [candidate division TM6 bacterium GW2011_GWF2_33_332]HBS47812.1 hypothetical protein [Candidatus Dependentiae bacterium]HBZ73212.1 hypothetical protein [Candidatus Dependentiae bacterium]
MLKNVDNNKVPFGIERLELGEKFTGNIFLFYVFDIGDEIVFDVIRKKGLLSLRETPRSPYFKNYHIPLSFDLPVGEIADVKHISVISKLYNFGAISLCYQIPFDDSLDDLKGQLVDIYEIYNRKSDEDVKAVFNKIYPAIEKPQFYQMKNSYYIVQVNPSQKNIAPEDFKEQYGSKIASLLRLETQSLSDYQEADILDYTTGYYGKDFMIFDSEASFIYDDEYFETLEFFESANIQLLELQYFDKFLDKSLEAFYLKPLAIPWQAYIPIVGRKFSTPISKLARMRVDISVIVERLDSSIKMVGDAYYSQVYSMLYEKLSLQSWQESINKKLDIIEDLYTVYQHQLELLHEEILTIVIILLIAVEAVLAFVK